MVELEAVALWTRVRFPPRDPFILLVKQMVDLMRIERAYMLVLSQYQIQGREVLEQQIKFHLKDYAVLDKNKILMENNTICQLVEPFLGHEKTEALRKDLREQIADYYFKTDSAKK